jgi:hypothetical protein
MTEEVGPMLHKLGYGRGDCIVLVPPNGPELATAMLCTMHWAYCIPHNACEAPSELTSYLEG